MVAQSITLDKLLDQIASMNTIEESNIVRQAMQAVKVDSETDDYERVRLALSRRLNQIITQGEKELADTDATIRR